MKNRKSNLSKTELYENNSNASFEKKLKLQSLKEMSLQGQRHQFIKAVEALGEGEYFHFHQYKSLVGSGIEFEFEQLLPFEMFEIEEELIIYEFMKEKIEEIVNIDNFWVIHQIVDWMFELGSYVSDIFLKKVVTGYRDDKYCSVVAQLCNNLEFTTKEEIRELSEFAEIVNLPNIHRLLADLA